MVKLAHQPGMWRCIFSLAKIRVSQTQTGTLGKMKLENASQCVKTYDAVKDICVNIPDMCAETKYSEDLLDIENVKKYI